MCSWTVITLVINVNHCLLEGSSGDRLLIPFDVWPLTRQLMVAGLVRSVGTGNPAIAQAQEVASSIPGNPVLETSPVAMGF